MLLTYAMQFTRGNMTGPDTRALCCENRRDCVEAHICAHEAQNHSEGPREYFIRTAGT